MVTLGESEVDALLEVWSNRVIQRQLGGSYRNKAEYRKIEAELAKHGVREWKQCRDVAVAWELKQRLQSKGLGWPGITSKAVEKKQHLLTNNTA